jgi:hypothetical protein
MGQLVERPMHVGSQGSQMDCLGLDIGFQKVLAPGDRFLLSSLAAEGQFGTRPGLVVSRSGLRTDFLGPDVGYHRTLTV